MQTYKLQILIFHLIPIKFIQSNWNIHSNQFEKYNKKVALLFTHNHN